MFANHRDWNGWVLCGCGARGYIEKYFQLQESGETSGPYLRGIILPVSPDQMHQPFVFLVSHEPDGPADDVWFSYYKDLRPAGGRLKLGYGPGGPPVLGKEDVLRLVKHLLEIGCITREEYEL